jgi:predicted ABC-type sugar transport system permease subunit
MRQPGSFLSRTFLMKPLVTTTEATANVTNRIRWLDFLAAFRAWLFLGILLITFEIWARVAYHSTFFLNPFNIKSIAEFTVAPLLLALGQTFVIISGGIDLSVGFTMGLSAVVTAHVFNWAVQFGNPFLGLFLAVLTGLAIAVVPGLINGLLIADLHVPPFIGTLGMYGVARGAAFLLARGTTVPVQGGLLGAIGNGETAGLPNLVLLTVAILLVMHYLLSQTRYGQHIYAVGGNVNAALRAGINVRNNTLALYILSSLTAGCAGILYTAKFSAGAAQAGEPLLLDSIAAVVIGGASLFGGSGTIVGTVIGALIIAVIQYGLVFVNVEPFWQFVAVGVVIIISVLVDQIQKQVGKDSANG